MDNIKQNISETNKITNKDEYITNTAKKAIVKAAIALIVLVTTALILTRDLSRSYIEEHSLIGTYALGELLYDDDGNSYYDFVYEFESNGTVKCYERYYNSFEYKRSYCGKLSYNKFTDEYHTSDMYCMPLESGCRFYRGKECQGHSFVINGYYKKEGPALKFCNSFEKMPLTKIY